MNSFVKALLVSAAILCASMSVQAGPCDAVFNFDGNLSDTSGNGNDGTMIGEEGKLANPVFAPGRSGQALKLDGTSAMRAPVDLYIKKCPQLTISAWINVPEQGRTTTQFLLSTGDPQGPGFQLAGSILTLNGPGNGLWELDAIRPNSGWRFIAGIYDFAAGTYALHWRDREPEFFPIGEGVREWQDMLWVGAMDDAIAHPATGVLIDSVKITGGALSYEQLVALKNARHRQTQDDQSDPTQPPGSGTSFNADEAVAARQNRIPALPGSTGASSADNAAPPVNAPAKQLSPAPIGEPQYSDIAGVQGTDMRQLDLKSNFFTIIVLRFSPNVNYGYLPFRITANSSDARGFLQYELPGYYIDNERTYDDVLKVISQETAISRLEICGRPDSSGPNRISGLRIWGMHVAEDGSLSYRPAAQESWSSKYPHCDNDSAWSPSVLCPGDTVGTGLVAHSRTTQDGVNVFTGLQLICRAVGLE